MHGCLIILYAEPYTKASMMWCPQQCHFEDVHSRVEKFIRVLVVEAAEQGRKENVKIIIGFTRT
jgi:hypothetical protein